MKDRFAARVGIDPTRSGRSDQPGGVGYSRTGSPKIAGSEVSEGEFSHIFAPRQHTNAQGAAQPPRGAFGAHFPFSKSSAHYTRRTRAEALLNFNLRKHQMHTRAILSSRSILAESFEFSLHHAELAMLPDFITCVAADKVSSPSSSYSLETLILESVRRFTEPTRFSVGFFT